MEAVYLSRKNLLDLLSKLDAVKDGIPSACAILKRDDRHPVYPQSMPEIMVKAVEDEDYYVDRKPGPSIRY